jgi:hypothetical protein
VFRARYNDECFRPRGDYGEGLYFGLHVASPEGNDWKIDLWGWEPHLYRSKVAESEELGLALQQLDRAMLLRLKTLASKHPLFRHQLTTHGLYRAALAHPASSAEQLLGFVEAQLAGSPA